MDSRHPHSVRLPRLIALLPAVLAGLFLFSSACPAQPVPAAPNQEVIKAPELTEAQTAAIKAFVEYWAKILSDPKSKPEDVQSARVELIKPLDGPNAMVASPDFRNTYSRFAVTALEPAMGADNAHTATNAFRVIAQLGTDRALSTLLAKVDVASEPHWQYRLRAADGCQVMLSARSLAANKMVEAAKKLAEAASHEDNNDVLRHQLAAIDVADQGGNAALTADDRKKIRLMLVSAINGSIDRYMQAGGKGEPPIAAVNTAVVNVRKKYTQGGLDAAELMEIGRRLAPTLGKMLQIASDNWQVGHGDEQDRRLYGTMVGTCDGFLTTIDAKVRSGEKSPAAKLRDDWNSGSKEKFDAGLKQWQEILAKPPYESK